MIRTISVEFPIDSELVSLPVDVDYQVIDAQVEVLGCWCESFPRPTSEQSFVMKTQAEEYADDYFWEIIQEIDNEVREMRDDAIYEFHKEEHL